MRCPDCNKFVSFDTDTEPEEQSADFDAPSLTINISVRIVNNCADCSTELKEATFELEHTLDESDLGEHDPDDLELAVEYERVEYSKGAGRYRQQFYGVQATWTLTAPDGKVVATDTLTDHVQASHMEELV